MVTKWLAAILARRTRRAALPPLLFPVRISAVSQRVAKEERTVLRVPREVTAPIFDLTALQARCLAR